jgi:hypothetical protein
MRKHGHVLSAGMRQPAYDCRAIAWSLIDILNFRQEPATHLKLIGQRVTLVASLAALVAIVCMFGP